MEIMLVISPGLFEQIFLHSSMLECRKTHINQFTQPKEALNEIVWQLTQRLLRRRLHMKYGYNWLSGFWGDVWNCRIMVSPGSKVKEWAWPHLPTNLCVLIKTTQIIIFRPKSSELCMKSYVLAFSHIWLCHKIGQVSPRSSFEQS